MNDGLNRFRRFARCPDTHARKARRERRQTPLGRQDEIDGDIGDAIGRALFPKVMYDVATFRNASPRV